MFAPRSLLLSVLSLAVLFQSSVAFTAPSIVQPSKVLQTSTTPVSFVPMLSSTALEMARPKIDIDESDEGSNRLNPAVFKNFAYLGSIAFAVLLPLGLLVWSATKP